VIRTNLSTRPFYNERLVNLWLLALAIVIVAATIFNVSRARVDAGSNTELATRAAQDEERAAELRRTAAQLRGSVDLRQIEAVSVDARQANDLIDRRTFSWTALFNQFESTLPDNVRITSIRPTIDKDRQIVLTVTVLARSVPDIEQFMERLDTLGAFKQTHMVQERTTDEEQIETSLEMVYSPQIAESPKP
jgi:Tfp pilus assembly protein PilN